MTSTLPHFKKQKNVDVNDRILLLAKLNQKLFNPIYKIVDIYISVPQQQQDIYFKYAEISFCLTKQLVVKCDNSTIGAHQIQLLLTEHIKNLYKNDILCNK